MTIIDIKNIKKDLTLQINKENVSDITMINFSLPTTDRCILHWGVIKHDPSYWHSPPKSTWPQETTAVGNSAVKTPFVIQKNSSTLTLKFKTTNFFSAIVFVLFFPDHNSWANNSGNNFMIPINATAPHSEAQLEKLLEEKINGAEIFAKKIFKLANGERLAAATYQAEDRIRAFLISTTPPPLLLHWGITQKSQQQWLLPELEDCPLATTIYQNAVRTPFKDDKDGNSTLLLDFAADKAPGGINFVLFQSDSDRWLKSPQGNFHLPFKPINSGKTVLSNPQLDSVIDEIIEAETGRNSWTLMHRFNLCHNLLERVNDEADGLAILFVWLRFSALRQLTWQRNYNTQPRDLSHSQLRLTLRLASQHRAAGGKGREMIHHIFATIGRGGEGGKGQQIRDGILHIMHRHRIKEVSGHFMEEWHQKIHNNTTPDDIVICEAYLAFLHSNGNHDVFYNTLRAEGVTKERLAGFERPIVTDPDFVPHLKEGLIHDFDDYLKLLKSIHSATDFITAVEKASLYLPEDMKALAWEVHHFRDGDESGLYWQAERISRLRSFIHQNLEITNDDYATRDLIYLDLGLEEALRNILEANIHKKFSLEILLPLISPFIDNVCFSFLSPEISICAEQWKQLHDEGSFNQDWFLRAAATLERISQALAAVIDSSYSRLQPKAELLGNAFGAEKWTIELFTQEFLRGSTLFCLSQLLHHIFPLIRKNADLGPWLTISQADASGELIKANLADIQEQQFSAPTVIFSEKITGNEEIPFGVTGVVTGQAVDILAHVAIRARNASILFASCFDTTIIDNILKMEGKSVSLSTLEVTDIQVVESSAPKNIQKEQSLSDLPSITCPPASFQSYAVTMGNFSDSIVGSKSLQLKKLKMGLPDWINVPKSVAIPFGVCEKLFSLALNSEVSSEHVRLSSNVNKNPATILPKLRQCTLKLNPNKKLKEKIQNLITNQGLSQPDKDNDFFSPLWERIKQVWASKWTERAYWSRKKYRIDHASLSMAVLIQEVVDADYAFVLHTANPFTGNRDELYGEVVIGLGEVLCSGNYPGRALGFTCKRAKSHHPEISAYPSKGLALRGKGLIARSDSNGEDLDKYAGAGLYDSFLINPPQEQIINYQQHPLMTDPDFRKKLLCSLAKLGWEVERLMNSTPQDIEGAWSNGKFYIVQTRPQIGIHDIF